jgi:hypothetical protein
MRSTPYLPSIHSLSNLLIFNPFGGAFVRPIGTNPTTPHGNKETRKLSGMKNTLTVGCIITVLFPE